MQVRDAIEQALRRLRIVPPGENMQAEDASTGLEVLNQMIYSWSTSGVDLLHQGWALTDNFVFFVPPKVLDPAGSTAMTLDSLSYVGTWNASTNSPALSDGSGTKGQVYRVGTAGSTSLDDVSSWAVDDFLIFNGTEWLKCASSKQHEMAVINNLAVWLASDYGMAPPDVVAINAEAGFEGMLAQWMRTPDATFDRALTRLPSRRWPYSVPASETS